MAHYDKSNYTNFLCGDYTCANRDRCAACGSKFGRYSIKEKFKPNHLDFIIPHLYLRFRWRVWGKAVFQVGCRDYQEKKCE